MPRSLKCYSKKRDFLKTPEPGAKVKRKPGGTLIFVIQKHMASRLHYDFRLECDGVLLSWAVPKGPSTDPSRKHLAVMVEDHPFGYKDFEGVIPKGQYGAGQVIVWDNGTYSPEGEPGSKKNAEALVKKGIRAGKLSFTLYGKKLKGNWTLIRLRGARNQWLLIKQDDQYAGDSDVTEQDCSVISARRLGNTRSTIAEGKRASRRKAPSPTPAARSKFKDKPLDGRLNRRRASLPCFA